MHISKITLTNFRRFQSLEMTFPEDQCVIIGNNGQGKTTILAAISLALSRIFSGCAYITKLPAQKYELSDIRSWTEFQRNKERVCYATTTGISCNIELDTDLACDSHYNISLKEKKTSGHFVSALTNMEIRENGRLSATLNQLVERGHSIPVIAHYGPHRGAKQGDRKRFARKHYDYTNPFAAYVRALEPSLDFESFLDWFREEEANELRQQRKNKKFKSIELETVRRAIERMMSDGSIKYSDPRFESAPMRFVLTEETEDGYKSERNFDQLSDGYRATIALIADFARRLAIAHRYSTPDIEPLDGEGILLIDEIDVHLHPSWQFRVMDGIHKTFPHVQLIVTTHSAEVVSGVDGRCIRGLSDEIKDVQLNQSPISIQTQGMNTTFIGERLMFYRSTPSLPINKTYNHLMALLQQGDITSPEFEQTRLKFINHFGENHPFVLQLNNRISILERIKSQKGEKH